MIPYPQGKNSLVVPTVMWLLNVRKSDVTWLLIRGLKLAKNYIGTERNRQCSLKTKFKIWIILNGTAVGPSNPWCCLANWSSERSSHDRGCRCHLRAFTMLIPSSSQEWSEDALCYISERVVWIGLYWNVILLFKTGCFRKRSYILTSMTNTTIT